MKSLKRRIRKMEEASGKKQTIMVWKNPGESFEEVTERHLSTHPEHRGQGFDLAVIGWMEPGSYVAEQAS